MAIVIIIRKLFRYSVYLAEKVTPPPPSPSKCPLSLNENFIFFRRNTDDQWKIDLSSNFFFLFPLKTPIIKTFEKVNLEKENFQDEPFTQEKLIFVIISNL